MSDEFLKCSCNHCAGRIEFPASGEGATVPCPHCGHTTRLSVASSEAVPNAMDEPVAPRAAAGSRSRVGLAATIAVVTLLAGISATAIWFSTTQRKKHFAAPVSSSDSASTNQADPSAAADSAAEAGPATAAGATAVAVPKSPDDLKAGLVTLEKAKGTSLVYAIGLLRNDSDHQRFGIKVEIEVIDAAGNKVGTARDYRAVLEPRQGWRFRALVLDKRAAAARLVSIEEDQ